MEGKFPAVHEAGQKFRSNTLARGARLRTSRQARRQ